jgi:serine/threonine protein kinase
MECQYIKSNNENCKYKAIHEFYDTEIQIQKNYCTRHYNQYINKEKKKEQPDIIEQIDINNDIIIYKNVTKNIIFKYQDISNNKNLLQYEYKLLTEVFTNHINIIKYSNYELHKKKDVTLKLDFIPISYDELKTFNLTDVQIKNIALQLIQVMKYIHSKKYLYIDLNPSNIRFILENSIIVVKLINFNSCIKYINNNSQFYTNDKLPDKQGNNYYSSRNINLGYRGVRLDDIESILYILLDLVNNAEFLKIKTLKQIGRILNIKYGIFQNKTNHEYINDFIDLINQLISNNDLNKDLSNRSINYNKFIKIFS